MEKQKLILDAAIQAFAEKGYYEATIYDISQKAGVATGSIYFHFKNKLDLLLSIIIRFWEETNQQIEEGTKGKNPRERLEAILGIIWNFLKKDKKALCLAKVLLETLPYIFSVKNKDLRKKRDKITKENRKFVTFIDKIIEEGQQQGFFCNTIRPAALRWVLYGSIQMILYGLFVSEFRHEEIGFDETDIQKIKERLFEKLMRDEELESSFKKPQVKQSGTRAGGKRLKCFCSAIL